MRTKNGVVYDRTLNPLDHVIGFRNHSASLSLCQSLISRCKLIYAPSILNDRIAFGSVPLHHFREHACDLIGNLIVPSIFISGQRYIVAKTVHTLSKGFIFAFKPFDSRLRFRKRLGRFFPSRLQFLRLLNGSILSSNQIGNAINNSGYGKRNTHIQSRIQGHHASLS